MQNELKARDTATDLIKTFAIFGVLLIHAGTAGFGANQVGDFNWYSALLWGTVSRASVPLFFLCTGYLFLRPEKEVTLRQIFTKNLPRVVVALFAWALFYSLYHLIENQTLSLPELIQAVKNVLLFRHEFHLYYLHITILIYVLVPLLRVFTAHATVGQVRYALVIWFLLGICYPTLRPFWPFSLLGGIPAQYALNMTWAASGYCLLGWHLRTCPPKRRWLCPALWAGGLAFLFIATAAASYQKGSLAAQYLEGMSIGVAVMAVGIFGTLSRVKLSKRLAAAARVVSQASFTVYLSHVLFLELFERHLGWTAANPPAILTIPLIALAAFACSLLLWAAARCCTKAARRFLPAFRMGGRG